MKAKKNHNPLFILCSARSGSTLLRYILDTHPKVSCPPELHLGSLIKQLTWVYGNTSSLKKTNAKDKVFFEDILTKTRQNISRIMNDHLREKGKQIWCDKSVSTIESLDLINSVFPKARYLCLHRDCMDFVHSALETMTTDPTGKNYGFEYYFSLHPNCKITALIDYWVTQTSKTLQFEQKHKDHCCRIRYEDIASQPDETLPQLFQFLGLKWNTALTEKIFSTQHDVGPGDHKIRETNKIQNSSIGNGTNISIPQISGDLLSKMNRLRQILGYA